MGERIASMRGSAPDPWRVAAAALHVARPFESTVSVWTAPSTPVSVVARLTQVPR